MQALRPRLVIVAALLLVGVTGWAARPPQLSAAARTSLAARYSFQREPLVPAVRPQRQIRTVEPQLRRIAAWISAVGAAVAITDADGNGRPDDVCLVDPRSDSTTVEPAPGTGRRFAPFALWPQPLPYDARTTAPMGCLPADVNEDGLTDFVVYYWGRTPVLFVRRTGVPLGPDAYARRELVRPVQRWYTDSISAADVDGDGHIDLVVGNYFPDGARVLDAQARSDPLMQMQDSMSRATNGGADRILLWSGPGRFREAVGALTPAVAHGWTLAVGAADLDGDLRPEIYFANDFGPDRLLRNESRPGHVRLVPVTGRRGFTTPGSKVLGHDSFKGMGIDFGDLLGNGRLDMFVSNITTEWGLEESNFAWIATGKTFVDRSEQLGLARSGWAWDAKFGDFDNDGRLELVQATGFVRGDVNRWPELHELAMANDTLLHHPSVWPRFDAGVDLSGREANRFFAVSGGRYWDVAGAIGLGDPVVSRGVATADVNGDGRLDFAVADQWAPSYLYLNTAPHAGAFLALDLMVPVAGARRAALATSAGFPRRADRGRPAIGATVVLQRPDGGRTIAEVDGGNGHASVRSTELLFGLGASPPRRVAISIAWRDASGVRRARLALAPGRHTILLPSR